MGVELCSGCGEEHEPPRGIKCKSAKAKLAKKIKMERDADSDSTSPEKSAVEEIADQMAGLMVAESSKGAGKADTSKSARAETASKDEEEEALIREIAELDRERRKTKLKTVLDKKKKKLEAAEQIRAGGSGCRQRKRDKKASHRRSRRDESSGSSDSDSSKDSSSDSTDSDWSRSRSRSRTRRRRRRRGKFAIDRYTKGKKRVSKLVFSELLYAACMWGHKRSVKMDWEIEQAAGYMGHLAYLCMHATTNNYSDEAYRGYDEAIREKAKDKGMKAFRLGDTELSLLHFNMDNTRSNRETVKATVKSSKKGSSAEGSKAVKGVCYGHNYNKEGCVRKKCDWDHRCVTCKSWDHTYESCPSKKY